MLTLCSPYSITTVFFVDNIRINKVEAQGGLVYVKITRDQDQTLHEIMPGRAYLQDYAVRSIRYALESTKTVTFPLRKKMSEEWLESNTVFFAKLSCTRYGNEITCRVQDNQNFQFRTKITTYTHVILMSPDVLQGGGG